MAQPCWGEATRAMPSESVMIAVGIGPGIGIE